MSKVNNTAEATTEDTTVATAEQKAVNKKQNKLLKKFNLEYDDIKKIDKKYISDDAPLATPLNYMGNKYELVSQIAPLLKKDINKFYDVFGGSFTMGINVNANEYVYNELNEYIFDLIESLSKGTVEDNYKLVEDVFDKYNLHKKNKSGFTALRNDYNNSKERPWQMLYVLGITSVNYYHRFNKKGNFNNGYSGGIFNESLRAKFILFTKKLIEMERKITFSNDNALKILKTTEFKKNDFVYLDPVYMATKVKYGVIWNEAEEKEFLKSLDILKEKGVDFALSNVFQHDSESNHILIEWAKKYNVHYLNKKYSISDKKDRETVEVLITSYDTIAMDNQELIQLVKEDTEIIQGRLVNCNNEVENILLNNKLADIEVENAKSFKKKSDIARINEINYRKRVGIFCSTLQAKFIKGAYGDELKKAGISSEQARRHISVVQDKRIMALTNKELSKVHNLTYSKILKMAKFDDINFQKALNGNASVFSSKKKPTNENPFSEYISDATYKEYREFGIDKNIKLKIEADRKIRELEVYIDQLVEQLNPELFIANMYQERAA